MPCGPTLPVASLATVRRARLMGGLLTACQNLAAAGCTELLLDGSFVTTKPLPGDYDGAWETAGVDPDRPGSGPA